MHYGSSIIHSKEHDAEGEDITVIQFIIGEIEHDELVFTNSGCKQIYEEIKQNFETNTILDTKFFIQHPDEKLSRMAIDMISTPYSLSKIWGRHETFIETEDMKLKSLVPECLMAFKSKRVQVLLKETEDLMMEAQKEKRMDDIVALQQRYIALTSYKKELSKNLGNRIII